MLLSFKPSLLYYLFCLAHDRTVHRFFLKSNVEFVYTLTHRIISASEVLIQCSKLDKHPVNSFLFYDTVLIQ